MAKTAEMALVLSLVDEVSKTAKSIKDDLKGVGKSSQGAQEAIRSLGKIGLGAVGGLAGVVAGVSAAMGGLAIKALPIEGVRDAFRGLNEDADAALSRLREGALGMVKDADLMRSYNSAAQLVGQTFADQLPDAMGYLSKVSAATGEDMGFMVDSLVKGIGRLSPMILDNLGIQVNLVEANEAYAASVGKTVDELTKEEQQQALMAQAMEKLAQNTAKMPEVAGTAQQTWASLGTTFGNIKDTLGLSLVPALSSLMTPVTELAQTYGPMLADVFATKVVPAVENVAGALGMMISGDLEGGLDALFGPERTQRILEIAGAVQDFAKQAGDFVREHAPAIKAALIAIGGLLAAATIASGIMSVVAAIGALANPVTLIIAAVGLLAVAWKENWGGIQEKTAAAIEFVRGAIQAGLDWIRGFWAEHGETIIATARGLWDSVRGAFDAGVTWVREVVDKALSAIRAFWDEHGEGIMETVGHLWDVVQGYFAGAFDFISGIFEAFRLAFEGDWYGFGVKIRETGIEAWERIQQIFEDFKLFLAGVWALIEEDVTRIWEGILEWLGAVPGKVIAFFTETDWAGIGSDILTGIGNGLSSGLEWLKEKARDAARAALDAMKGLLGISSPSRVASLEVGLPIGQGIVEGLRAATPGLLDASRGMMDSTIGALAGSGAGYAQRVTPAASARQLGLTGRVESLGPEALAQLFEVLARAVTMPLGQVIGAQGGEGAPSDMMGTLRALSVGA